MAHVQAWRSFKRMQATACAFASLVYAGATIHAWRVLPGAVGLKAMVTLAFPAFYCLAAFVAPLAIRPFRRSLKRYIWMSFRAGFGQTPVSVLSGLGVLAVAAVVIYLQIAGYAHGGRYPSGVFSGYGAGIGIVFAQALLVFDLEKDPEVRTVIEA